MLFYILEDILDAIVRIEKYSAGLSFPDFAQSSLVIDAVIRNFEIIGEATRNVPKAIKEKYPGVEWKEAAGFRNVLIHDYFSVDVEAVWDTIQRNIPSLKRSVQRVIAAEESAK